MKLRYLTAGDSHRPPLAALVEGHLSVTEDAIARRFSRRLQAVRQ